MEDITNLMKNMNIEEEFEEEDDISIILTEEDRKIALANNVRIAYYDIDLDDSDMNNCRDPSVIPTRKNIYCLCLNSHCPNIHNLDDLVLFPCREQTLCKKVIYNGYFINVDGGCFNLHGNEKREDFFIRNGLVNKPPKYVEQIKFNVDHDEKNIMYRPRRYTVKPDENVIKTLVCQSIKNNIVCRYGNDCTFAHKYSELKVSMCKLKNCNKYKGFEACPYIHNAETILSFIYRNNFHLYFPDEIQLPQFPPPVPVQEIKNFYREQQFSIINQYDLNYDSNYDSKYKTKLCKNINCTFGIKCKFAHSLSELRK